MIIYLLEKWQLKRRFEPVENGHLFRRHGWSEGYFFSEAEQIEALRLFRAAYWRRHIKFWTVSFAVLLAWAVIFAVVQTYLPTRLYGLLQGVTGWGLIIAVMAAIVRLSYQLQNTPLELTAGREPSAPANGLKRAIVAHFQKRSWLRVFIWAVFTVSLAAIFVPVAFATTGGIVAWFAYFGVCAAGLALNVVFKLRVQATRD